MAIIVLILSFLAINSPLAFSDAEVFRTKNLQHLQTQACDTDVIRLMNLQMFELQPNNADIIRPSNIQYLELGPNNADVIRLGNLQFFELAPLGELVINVGPIMITDQDGYPKNVFQAGDVVEFWFVVENIGELKLTRGLISVVVIDPSATPTYLGYTFVDLASGESRHFIMGYATPLTAPSGSYAVKVMVFTNWPSKGGIGLDIETSTFNIR